MVEGLTGLDALEQQLGQAQADAVVLPAVAFRRLLQGLTVAVDGLAKAEQTLVQPGPPNDRFAVARLQFQPQVQMDPRLLKAEGKQPAFRQNVEDQRRVRVTAADEGQQLLLDVGQIPLTGAKQVAFQDDAFRRPAQTPQVSRWSSATRRPAGRSGPPAPPASVPPRRSTLCVQASIEVLQGGSKSRSSRRRWRRGSGGKASRCRNPRDPRQPEKQEYDGHPKGVPADTSSQARTQRGMSRVDS